MPALWYLYNPSYIFAFFNFIYCGTVTVLTHLDDNLTIRVRASVSDAQLNSIKYPGKKAESSFYCTASKILFLLILVACQFGTTQRKNCRGFGNERDSGCSKLTHREYCYVTTRRVISSEWWPFSNVLMNKTIQTTNYDNVDINTIVYNVRIPSMMIVNKEIDWERHELK